VHCARDELLARACLARDEQGRLGRSHAVDEREDAPHRGRVADHLIDARLVLHAAQALDLDAQRVELRGARHAERELFDFEGLREEVVCARADRGDRGVEIAEGRDEDHRHVRALEGESLAELEARHALHAHVGHDRLEALLARDLERSLGAGSPRDAEASLCEPAIDERSERRVVLHEEHVGCVGHRLGF
jgi:hypothetical protein